MRRILFAVAAAATQISIVAAATLDVHLGLTPTTVLPGLPISIALTVTNHSANSVSLPEYAMLFIKSAEESFPARWYPNRKPYAPVRLWYDATVPANATANVDRPASGMLVEANWLDEPRLNHPGRYEFQLVLTSQRSEDSTIPRDAIRSNVVEVVVSDPIGDDAVVWHEMLQLGAGEWRPDLAVGPQGWALSQKVVSEYPHTQYAGWFAATGVARDPAVAAAALRAWLGRGFADDYTDWRYLRLANFEEFAARYWGPDGKPEEYRKHVAASRALLEELLRRGKNRLVLEDAKKKLDDIGEMEQRIPK